MTDANAENQTRTKPGSVGKQRSPNEIGPIVHDGRRVEALRRDLEKILKPRESAPVVSAVVR